MPDQKTADQIAQLKDTLDEYRRLMADPVVLAGLLVEVLQELRDSGRLPAPR